MKNTSKPAMCPITKRGCRLCTLYRARHYYALSACKEYRERLHILGAHRAPKEKSEASG